MSRSDSASQLALSAKARRTGEQPISFLMAAALADPNLINFAAGLVDPLTLPVEATQQIVKTIFANERRARAALQYDTTLGLASLRQAALRHLEKLEKKPAADFGLTERDIVVTTGSQQALYLIGDVLIDPGDIVITANPCYFVYTGTLASLGASVMTVPMTEDGIDVEAIEKLLTRLERENRLDRVKLIYTTSYFQNPTGLTLGAAARPRLLEIARKFSRRQRILILEDAAYRELRYDGPDLPSIKSLDRDNHHTILTQTFSKPFAPGLKTGYTAMPTDLLEAVLHQKGNHDFGSPSLAQHIAAEAMTSGLYDQHVQRLCAAYRAKRDAMLDALRQHIPGAAGVTWTHPSGGLYVWVTLPTGMDASRTSSLFRMCVEKGVLYVPGDYCFQADENGVLPRNHLRLSFGQVAPDQIGPGIQRLAQAIAAVVGQPAPTPSAPPNSPA
ncbi:MAG TPA: PLP-dependent aminotransferase family protein [Tepidisphaeraceae bacterium]|jgi:2-aminoadipate transaminase|nr:PLP-dependent aminotransferase family protein [Tepidisphaeraceae bacterium]